MARRTLFGRLERRDNPFENPAIPLTDAGLLNFFGGEPTDAGVNMNQEIAMRLSTVFRCVTLLAGVVGSLPLKIYNHDDKSVATVPCLRGIGSVNTPNELWETAMIHMLLWGNAYIHKVRNGLGQIVELRLIHPQRCKPQLVVSDSDNPMAGKIFEVQNANSGQWFPYTDFEIMHLMGPSIDGIKGMSRISLARESMAIGLAADKLAAKLFGNGNLISGVLSVERSLNKDDAEQLKARWRQKMAGLKHSHDIAILDGGVKFTPIALPPEDVQFLQSRQWQTLEVCRWFGVPPHLAGETTKSTTWGTGLEEQNTGLLKYTLQSYLSRIEQRVTREIANPETQFAEFLVDGLLRASMQQRFTAWNLAVMGGWLTRNEARAKENLPPLPGLDEPLIPTLSPPADYDTEPSTDEPDNGPFDEDEDEQDPSTGGPDDEDEEDPVAQRARRRRLRVRA